MNNKHYSATIIIFPRTCTLAFGDRSVQHTAFLHMQLLSNVRLVVSLSFILIAVVFYYTINMLYCCVVTYLSYAVCWLLCYMLTSTVCCCVELFTIHFFLCCISQSCLHVITTLYHSMLLCCNYYTIFSKAACYAVVFASHWLLCCSFF